MGNNDKSQNKITLYRHSTSGVRGGEIHGKNRYASDEGSESRIRLMKLLRLFSVICSQVGRSRKAWSAETLSDHL